MFVRVKPGVEKPRPPSDLHPWVLDADRRSTQYYANPARPSVFGWDGNRLRDIRKCKPDRLRVGDVVSFTFTVCFLIGTSTWWPQFSPLELVRVAEGGNTAPTASDDIDFSVPVVPATVRRRLVDGEVVGGMLFGVSPPLILG